MKSYKEFKQEFIGDSDIATLIMVGPTVSENTNKYLTTEPLPFGEDASYKAYMVEGKAEIGSHYHLVAEFKHWLKIYDDEELTLNIRADHIKVYRAGEMGCIIQTL